MWPRRAENVKRSQIFSKTSCAESGIQPSPTLQFRQSLHRTLHHPHRLPSTPFAQGPPLPPLPPDTNTPLQSLPLRSKSPTLLNTAPRPTSRHLLHAPASLCILPVKTRQDRVYSASPRSARCVIRWAGELSAVGGGRGGVRRGVRY